MNIGAHVSFWISITFDTSQSFPVSLYVQDKAFSLFECPPQFGSTFPLFLTTPQQGYTDGAQLACSVHTRATPVFQCFGLYWPVIGLKPAWPLNMYRYVLLWNFSHVYIMYSHIHFGFFVLRMGLYFFFPKLCWRFTQPCAQHKVFNKYLLNEWMTYQETSRCVSPLRSRTHCCGEVALASDSTDRQQLLCFGNC